MTIAQPNRVIQVRRPVVPGSRVYPMVLDGPRGFLLHELVLADDGERRHRGRVAWDGREGWAVVIERDRA